MSVSCRTGGYPLGVEMEAHSTSQPNTLLRASTQVVPGSKVANVCQTVGRSPLERR